MRQDDLPFSNIAHEFVGADHGGAGVCLILVDAAPGRGPGLHRHPYHEVFLVHAGVCGAWFAPLFDQPALDGFRVIRPIRPGYGLRPAPSEPAASTDASEPSESSEQEE